MFSFDKNINLYSLISFIYIHIDLLRQAVEMGIIFQLSMCQHDAKKCSWCTVRTPQNSWMYLLLSKQAIREEMLISNKEGGIISLEKKLKHRLDQQHFIEQNDGPSFSCYRL